MLDQLLHEKPKITTSAKYRAIPSHILFFCQTLHSLAKEKFEMRADSVVAEFLFDRWLIKALCEDGNKNGLITTIPIAGALKNNLSMVREALTALISAETDYEIVIEDMPISIH